MSTFVIILKEKKPAKELVLKLREAQTPILNCDLVEPLDNRTENEDSDLDTSEEEFANQSNFNNIKLLNPALARKGRQKAPSDMVNTLWFYCRPKLFSNDRSKYVCKYGVPKCIREALRWLQ